MVYVRVTGRVITNIHSANAEGAVGNYMALSKMFIVRRIGEGYEVSEEPVISGNMIKHWHAVATTEILKSWGYEKAICESCNRHVMYRSVLKKEEEFNYIESCAIEDLHGFLDTDTNIRRESLVKFSFMIPVEEQRSEFSSITHNRVVIDETGKIPSKEQAMMVMKREHASGIYGFLCSMDLAFAGVSLANPDKKLGLNERKIRAKAAIAALTEVLSGHFGAAQARALPIVKTVELICITSKRPIPNAVHGFYKDYAEETASIIKAIVDQRLVEQNEIKVVVMGERLVNTFKEKKISIDEVKTASEAIAKVMGASDQWF
ncbi:MAG: type I-A CRISPR-associated protein Cas7/Csa2 [Nitrososphaerota archaeon]|nr:type I-A CRISPR-associated protein Cas7/Csa2 [Nitrososphaerales archaeon]MDW8045419.1 type I-A CRISPR-associated protein Cas7/Csa2 [Nitrososphaerota archaeon]